MPFRSLATSALPCSPNPPQKQYRAGRGPTQNSTSKDAGKLKGKAYKKSARSAGEQGVYDLGLAFQVKGLGISGCAHPRPRAARPAGRRCRSGPWRCRRCRAARTPRARGPAGGSRCTFGVGGGQGGQLPMSALPKTNPNHALFSVLGPANLAIRPLPGSWGAARPLAKVSFGVCVWGGCRVVGL